MDRRGKEMAAKNPSHSKVISVDQLSSLSPTIVYEGGRPGGGAEKCSLEFEDGYLLLNGETFHDDKPSFVRRSGALIELWCSRRAKFMFTLESLRGEWTDALEDGSVYLVN
jgi:hypothetical protein